MTRPLFTRGNSVISYRRYKGMANSAKRYSVIFYKPVRLEELIDLLEKCALHLKENTRKTKIQSMLFCSLMSNIRSHFFDRIARYFIMGLFGLSMPVFAQQQNLKFEHIGTQEGLSHSNVICILQDSRGFMWFGTRDGLNRYDGYTFTVFRNDMNDKNSLGHNMVNDIVEDSDGVLWIATWGGGLSQFNRETEKFVRYKHDKNNPSSISSDLINSLLIDSEGVLWIGTEDEGLDRFNKKDQTFSHYANDPENPNSLSQNSIKDIIENQRHNLLIATAGGLNVYDRNTKSFTRYQHNELNPKSIGSNNVLFAFEDSKHRVWIGTRGGGLNLFYSDTGEFERLKSNDRHTSSRLNVVISINEDDRGDIWIGTENNGLCIYDSRSSELLNFQEDYGDPSSLSHNSVWAIYKDAKGEIWVGTFSGGINHWSSDANKFAHYRHTASKNSLSHNKVLCVYEDSKNNLWVGTDGGGVNLFDRQSGNFTHYMHEPGNSNSMGGNYVLCITEDSYGNLWTGTWGDGITVYNKKNNTYRHFKNDPKNPKSLSSNNVWTIFEDRDKNIWIGTYYGGLNLYNSKEETFSHFRYHAIDPASISSDKINSIFEDRNGQLWIGTEGSGLDLFNKKTGKFIHFKHDETKNSIASNTVGNIMEDLLGNLWIGTMAGLNYLDVKTNKFTVYQTIHGLPNNSIFGLEEDSNGHLWIGTNKGLSRFDSKRKTFTNYESDDGLQSKEFKQNASHRSRSGAMYFGGNNGLNEFFPESIKVNHYDPPIVLTDFQLFNKRVVVSDSQVAKSPLRKYISETKELTLTHKQSVFSLEFASLNYVSPDKKRYQYVLEGFDRNWNTVEAKRTATYTNLDPGEYTFKVRGLDNSGKWSENIRTLKIIVTPPLWKTWWFRASVVFLFIAGIYYSHRFRIKVIEKAKKTLETQVKERTEELNQQKEDIQSQSRYLESINSELIVQREEATKAKAEADRANQAKSIFLATMSHEIRTPMNGVLGMASLLAETSLTAEQKEYTETILGSGDALLRVINDILDFSKIESGNLELDNHGFDLRQCIEDVLDVFSAKAAQKGLDLVYQIDYQIPAQIIGDSHRLRQILLNLVGNAMKFTQQGEIFIGVELLKIDNDQLELAFQIRDTGVGIPQDKLSRLFRAFSQVDSSTTRKYGGTGLGLVISQRLVELMGGSIAVESQPGVGSSFGFTIKGLVSQQSIRQYVNANLVEAEVKKVLVVDDNVTTLIILKNQLEQWKLLPVLASSGSEALDILAQQEKFDLVITDMQMPVLDGVQLTKLIKSKHPSVPVILLSSIGDESKKKHPDLFSAVLNKPVKQQQFSRVLHAVFSPEGNGMPLEDQKPKQVLFDGFAERNPLRILIAEDNPVNQKLTTRVLNKLGYKEIVIAQNGLEAIEKFDEQFFDVIFMDIQMPELDGLEATRMIRLKHYQQPVIIAMTANAMEGDREGCMKASMDDYISKPVVLEILVSTLEKWSAAFKEKALSM